MQPEAHSSPSSADADAQLAAVLVQNAGLTKVNNQQREEINRLHQENADRQERLEKLAKQVDQLKRLLFGPRSERFVLEPDPQQGTLFEEEQKVLPEPDVETDQPKRKKRKPKRRPDFDDLPADLPRETIVIEPDVDTTGLDCIGEEKTRYLKRVPSQVIVVEIIRPKYVDPRNEDRGVIIGKLPPRVVPKGMAGPSMLADILVSKYGDHLPLYRQRQRFLREGIEIPKSTLGGWVAQSVFHLGLLYDALIKEALSSGYLQADETRIQVQDPNKKGKTHRGFYWLYHTPEKKLLVMEYHKSRGRASPVAFLHGYAGLLQADGYFAASPAAETASSRPTRDAHELRVT